MRVESGKTDARKFLPGLGDLIDLMTVTQLRLTKSGSSRGEDARLNSDLKSDISSLLQDLTVDVARLVELVISLSQLNAEIWNLKDKMSEVEEGSPAYSKSLTLAHQLNGYRNQMRNDLNSLASSNLGGLVRSNTNPDGLERWTPESQVNFEPNSENLPSDQ